MPCCGSSCTESVWRVPKLTSLRILASMFAAEISLRIFSIFGFCFAESCACCANAEIFSANNKSNRHTETRRNGDGAIGRFVTSVSSFLFLHCDKKFSSFIKIPAYRTRLFDMIRRGLRRRERLCNLRLWYDSPRLIACDSQDSRSSINPRL